MESINLPFTSENVEKALVEFYSPQSQFKPQLDVWLKHAQCSQDAWNFSWSLLDDKKLPEIQFFGASCLYNKVSKNFSDIPQEQYDSLKNKLLEKLIFYANIGPNLRLIQRKLNAALAKLALQLMPDEWSNCIDDIIQTIPNLTASNVPSQQLILIVIDLLTLLPEEFSSLQVNKSKKASVKHFLYKNFDKVKSYLQKLFTDSSFEANLVECGIKCLSSWGEFGVFFDQMNVFVNFLFGAVYNDALFEASCDCLTSMFTIPENSKFMTTIFQHIPQILNLTNLLKKYVENKDTDGCVVLTKLILAFAENQIRNIFDVVRFGDNQSKGFVFNLINIVLTLSSIPGNFPVDEESTDLTFVFWYTFQDELLAIDETGHLKEIFRPIFINLLEIFIIKLQLNDSYDKWTEDEKERLRCYRIDIGDTMVYMISIIGDIMMEYIIKRLLDSIGKKFDWKIQESLIYMLQSVVTELNESTNPEYNCSNDSYILEFVNLLPSINYCNKHILSTTLMAVGSLGNWLERNSYALPNVISLCLLGLKTETVTQSASFALKDIINDVDLSQYADQIITTCQECLKTGSLIQNYEVRLMSIIGLSISDVLNIDLQRAVNWVGSVIQPYLTQLEELLKLQQFDKQTQALTCHILNQLSTLLSSLSNRSHHDSLVVETSNEQKTIFRLIMSKLLPNYKFLVKDRKTCDNVIIDKIFESISVILSSSQGDGFDIYINDIIELIFSLNESSWRKYTYEVCRLLLIIYWKNDTYKQTLHQLFLCCNQNAMRLLSRDLNYFHEHTDIVEQYCTCLAKLLKSKCFDLFSKLTSESIQMMLQFSISALQLPEQYTLRAVTMFISNNTTRSYTVNLMEKFSISYKLQNELIKDEFVHYSKIEQHLKEIFESRLINFIQVIFIGICGAMPRHLVDLLANVLFVLLKEYTQQTHSLISKLFSETDFPNLNPTNIITKEKKLSFLKTIMSELSNKRKFKEIITEFSLTFRGLVNSEYAKETTIKY